MDRMLDPILILIDIFLLVLRDSLLNLKLSDHLFLNSLIFRQWTRNRLLLEGQLISRVESMVFGETRTDPTRFP